LSTLKELLTKELADNNIRNIDVYKDFDVRGRSSTKVKFIFDDADLRTLDFEATISNDLGMSTERKAELIAINARNQSVNLENSIDYEVEE
jgi:hypothetical protein